MSFNCIFSQRVPQSDIASSFQVPVQWSSAWPCTGASVPAGCILHTTILQSPAEAVSMFAVTSHILCNRADRTLQEALVSITTQYGISLQFAAGHGPVDSIPSVGSLCVA